MVSYAKPPRYTVKWTWESDLFSALSGETLDSYLATPEFSEAEVIIKPFELIKIFKSEDEKEISSIEIIPKYLRFQSKIGENFPARAKTHKYILASKYSQAKLKTLGAAVLYTYYLSSEEFNTIWDKLVSPSELFHLPENDNTMILRRAWKNAEKTNTYIIQVNFDKEKVDSDEASFSILYDNQYEKENQFNETDKIKEFIKYTITTNKSIGLEVT